MGTDGRGHRGDETLCHHGKEGICQPQVGREIIQNAVLDGEIGNRQVISCGIPRTFGALASDGAIIASRQGGSA